MISLKKKKRITSNIMLLVKCHFQHSVTEESCEEKHSLGHKGKLPSWRDRAVNLPHMPVISGNEIDI